MTLVVDGAVVVGSIVRAEDFKALGDEEHAELAPPEPDSKLEC